MENLKDIELIQKVIFDFGKTAYTLEECESIWDIRSHWWAAGWMNVYNDNLEQLYKECLIVLEPLQWMKKKSIELGLSFTTLEILDMCWCFSEVGYKEQFINAVK